MSSDIRLLKRILLSTLALIISLTFSVYAKNEIHTFNDKDIDILKDAYRSLTKESLTVTFDDGVVIFKGGPKAKKTIRPYDEHDSGVNVEPYDYKDPEALIEYLTYALGPSAIDFIPEEYASLMEHYSEPAPSSEDNTDIKIQTTATPVELKTFTSDDVETLKKVYMHLSGESLDVSYIDGAVVFENSVTKANNIKVTRVYEETGTGIGLKPKDYKDRAALIDYIKCSLGPSASYFVPASYLSDPSGSTGESSTGSGATNASDRKDTDVIISSGSLKGLTNKKPLDIYYNGAPGWNEADPAGNSMVTMKSIAAGIYKIFALAATIGMMLSFIRAAYSLILNGSRTKKSIASALISKLVALIALANIVWLWNMLIRIVLNFT